MSKRPWHSLSEAAQDGALEWHVRLTSGEANRAHYVLFTDWLSQSPEHFEAYCIVEQLSALIDASTEAGDDDAPESPEAGS